MTRVKKDWLWVIGLPLIFIATRLLLLHFIRPNYLYNFYEELYRGTIAKELLSGLQAPFYAYRADDYSGGSLVTGWLTVLPFRLFGPTAWALKWVPILLFAGTLSFWIALLRRCAPPRTAGYFALIFIFSPPLFTHYSLTTMGFHSDSVFFTAATLYLLSRIVDGPDREWGWFALLGLVAGFGLWFAYIYGLTLLAILLAWGLFDRRFPDGRRCTALAGGFVLGFSPWLAGNLWGPSCGLIISDMPLLSHFSWHQFLDHTRHLRQSALFEIISAFPADPFTWFERRLTARLYIAIFAVSAAVFFGFFRRGFSGRDRKRSRSLPIVLPISIIYVILFAAVLQTTDFLDTRYRTPLFPFFFVLLAWSWAFLRQQAAGKRRLWLTLLPIAWVGIALYTNRWMTGWEFRGLAHTMPGYSYRILPPAQTETANETLAYYHRTVKRLGARDRFELSSQTASLLAVQVIPSLSLNHLADWGTNLPDSLQPYYYYTAGQELFNRHPYHYDLWAGLAQLKAVRQRSRFDYELMTLGFFCFPSVYYPYTAQTIERFNEIQTGLTEDLKPYFWRALGHLYGSLWLGAKPPGALASDQTLRTLARVPKTYQSAFLEGLGSVVYLEWDGNPDHPPAAPSDLEAFPVAMQRDMLRGAGMECALEQMAGYPAENVWRSTLFLRGLQTANHEAFHDGERWVSQWLDNPL